MWSEMKEVTPDCLRAGISGQALSPEGGIHPETARTGQPSGESAISFVTRRKSGRQETLVPHRYFPDIVRQVITRFRGGSAGRCRTVRLPVCSVVISSVSADSSRHLIDCCPAEESVYCSAYLSLSRTGGCPARFPRGRPDCRLPAGVTRFSVGSFPWIHRVSTAR